MPRRPLLLLALLVLVAWSGALVHGGFAYDDREVLDQNPAVDGSVGWSQVFLRDYWEHLPAGAAGHYRPLATASLRLDRSLHGASALGCHLTNVLLHLAVVLAAAVLFGLRDKRLPLVGLALFAAHPALADSVAWISGRTSMISALGGLLGALVVARSARAGNGTGVGLGAGLAVLLATLGKEDGIVFAPLVVGLALERGRRLVPAALIGGLLGLGGYLLLRQAALGAWFPTAPHAPLAGEPLLERLRVAGGAGMEGLRVALWPVNYPPQWSLADLVGTASALALLAWGLLVAALAAGARRPRCDAFAGLALGALAVLPVAQLVPSGELLAARFLYLPLLLAAPALHALWREAGSRPWLAGLVLAPCIVLAWQRAKVYGSRASYWEARRAWRETPEVWNDLGNAYLEEGDRTSAEQAWRAALELRPDYSRPWVNLATLAMRDGEWSAAETLLHTALSARPSNPVAWANLGLVRRKLGRPEDAAEAYLRAIDLSPGAGILWRGLARARREAGDIEGARVAVAQALRLDPGDERARKLERSLDGE